jgi:hypothetical protein
MRFSLAYLYAAKYKKRTSAAIFKIAGPYLNKRIKAKNPIGATEDKIENNLINKEELLIPSVYLNIYKNSNKPDLSVYYSNDDGRIFEDIFNSIYKFSLRGTKALNLACSICGSK